MAKKTKSRTTPSQRTVPLTAYRVYDGALEIAKGTQKRAWMDALPERFAYRCLPLLIANQAGWDLLCPTGFSVRWNGKADLEAIKFKWDGDPHPAAASHFGSGVLTFTPGYLFRTPKDHNIWVKGCPNEYKDGIVPLEGIVETDWAPFTFTMNWKITRPKHWIRFEKGEPICRILPFPRHYLESVQPRTQELASDNRLSNQYDGWRQSRAQFIDDLHAHDEEAVAQGWQRTYVRGQNMSGAKMKDHQTKLQLREFLPSKK
ncbi:MAG: DUF6065 family protein [Gemmatimonadetes bacterium]|nr:DUF6065 family protein [Gemmatimonadota bacterium]